LKPIKLTGKIMNTYTRKIGMNRGKVRLWLEGAILNTNGFKHGDRFDVFTHGTSLEIVRNPEGKRKISGKPGREVIDMSAGTITAAFPTAAKNDVMQITATAGCILIKR
jgi:hypothetical protein